MIVEWLQWFGSPANIACLVGFWLFVGFLLILEALVPAFERDSERSHRWPANFSFALVNAGLLAVAPVSTVSCAEWAGRAGVGLLNQIAVPAWINIGCTLAVYSLTSYLIHIMLHKTQLLWRIHRVHHLDTHLDVTTSQRHHPLELMVNVLILALVTI